MVKKDQKADPTAQTNTAKGKLKNRLTVNRLIINLQ